MPLLFTSLMGGMPESEFTFSYQLGADDSLFDANTTSSMYQDTDKTQPVATSNDPIGYFERSTE